MKNGEIPDEVILFMVNHNFYDEEASPPGKQVLVGVYSPGTIVGELCLIDQRPRAVSAVAMEDTALLILTRDNLDKLVETHPRLGAKLLEGMLLAVSIRLRKAFERLASIF
jgi:CRP-like cAMP-binding protein